MPRRKDPYERLPAAEVAQHAWLTHQCALSVSQGGGAGGPPPPPPRRRVGGAGPPPKTAGGGRGGRGPPGDGKNQYIFCSTLVPRKGHPAQGNVEDMTVVFWTNYGCSDIGIQGF